MGFGIRIVFIETFTEVFTFCNLFSSITSFQWSDCFCMPDPIRPPDKSDWLWLIAPPWRLPKFYLQILKLFIHFFNDLMVFKRIAENFAALSQLSLRHHSLSYQVVCQLDVDIDQIPQFPRTILNDGLSLFIEVLPLKKRWFIFNYQRFWVSTFWYFSAGQNLLENIGKFHIWLNGHIGESIDKISLDIFQKQANKKRSRQNSSNRNESGEPFPHKSKINKFSR